MSDENFLLVDGNYFAYRSFYAVRDMGPSGDLSKNALYGFCRDLRNMLSRCYAKKAAVIWDGGLPQYRTSLLPEYKKQRPSMPDELRVQIPEIKKACGEFGVMSIRVEGEEADDVIASYSRLGVEKGENVVIATNDKDIFQIAEEKVRIYTTVKKYLSDERRYGLLEEHDVCRVWGVTKASLIKDVLSLMGDSSDNIPGVPGIGPKTATKLINSSGGVSELLADPVKYANPRISKLITEHRDNIMRNMQLVELNSEVALPLTLQDLEVKTEPENVADYLQRQGFPSLSRNWGGGVSTHRQTPNAAAFPYRSI
jgi:DNA polymerase-1